jgi:hypothetical protein
MLEAVAVEQTPHTPDLGLAVLAVAETVQTLQLPEANLV